METKQMTKKILDFQRGAISQWYDVMMSVQKQAASSVTSVLDQSDWIPKEGRQMMQNWVNACQKGCRDYKELMEESISGLEKVLVVPSRKPAATGKTDAKTNKPPVSARIKAETSAVTAKPVKPAEAAGSPTDATVEIAPDPAADNEKKTK